MNSDANDRPTRPPHAHPYPGAPADHETGAPPATPAGGAGPEKRRTERRRAPRRRADGAVAAESPVLVPPVREEEQAPGEPAREGTRPFPDSQWEIADWIKSELRLSRHQQDVLVQGVKEMLVRQERLWERSKADAINALVVGFARRMEQLKEELSNRAATVSSMAQYCEHVVEELTARANRDAKTQLINFTRFVEQLEVYLSVEQRGRWCAVGVVDITSFKWYNDTLGHQAGDWIIQRVARLLQEHVRAHDLLARDSRHELHARLGGDEFCFLIPDLEDWTTARSIAERFRDAVHRHDWTAENAAFAEKPVQVDVGVACLLLGPVSERRGRGHEIAQQLLGIADRLMYRGKCDRAGAVPLALRLENAALVPVDPEQHV